MRLGQRFKKAAKTAALIVFFFFAVYGAASFLNDYVIQYETIDGASMEPSLIEGERVLISPIPLWFHEPERFDIVAFSKGNELYVKRIIGLPGERISIESGNIYINGQRLPENYGKEKILEDMPAAALGKEEYFVLGDNRNYSKDSRDNELGAVKRKQIKGKVLFK